MRALIIDDERLARAELRRLLSVHPEIDIVGEAANAADAHQLIEELQPELLLLDIQMPGGSGFDLLAALDCAPEVIFTTAFDAYAIKAFDVSALDYLLKPVTAPGWQPHCARQCACQPGSDRTKSPPAKRSCSSRTANAAGLCRCGKSACSNRKAITRASISTRTSH